MKIKIMSWVWVARSVPQLHAVMGALPLASPRCPGLSEREIMEATGCTAAQVGRALADLVGRCLVIRTYTEETRGGQDMHGNHRETRGPVLARYANRYGRPCDTLPGWGPPLFQ